MASLHLDYLVASVAVEVLQCYEFLVQYPFYGAATGSNDVIGNNFCSTLTLSDSRPTGIRQTLREISGTLPELINALIRHNHETAYSQLSISFIKYKNCAGSNNGAYIPNISKLNGSPLYKPMSKLFAMRSGSGLLPALATPSMRPFTFPDLEPAQANVAYVPDIPANYATFILDGDGIILYVRGGAVNVNIPPELDPYRLAVTSVQRHHYAGHCHNDEGIQQMTILMSGSQSQIGTKGILDFSRPITIERAPAVGRKILRFGGIFSSYIQDDMWIGNYPLNTFDGSHYVTAYSIMKGLANGGNFMNRLTPIWVNAVTHNTSLQAATKDQLNQFVGEAIFSQACMARIGVDAGYIPGSATTGKMALAKVLSVIYSVYAIHTISNYVST